MHDLQCAMCGWPLVKSHIVEGTTITSHIHTCWQWVISAKTHGRDKLRCTTWSVFTSTCNRCWVHILLVVATSSDPLSSPCSVLESWNPSWTSIRNVTIVVITYWAHEISCMCWMRWSTHHPYPPQFLCHIGGCHGLLWYDYHVPKHFEHCSECP